MKKTKVNTKDKLIFLKISFLEAEQFRIWEESGKQKITYGII